MKVFYWGLERRPRAEAWVSLGKGIVSRWANRRFSNEVQTEGRKHYDCRNFFSGRINITVVLIAPTPA